jgi:hypothetical protein
MFASGQVLNRRFNRQIGWRFALENAIHVACRVAILVDRIGSVRDQAAGSDIVAERPLLSFA